MPIIRPSSELRNRYTEISDYCNEFHEPIFLTKNGGADLVLISNKQYEILTALNSLRPALAKGLHDLEYGMIKPLNEVLINLHAKIEK